ncbi:MAG: hypothetical protein HGA45_22200 [Chloroflexales bacterium]|nr:hypothetical protein [Chloroflexales bacterium]
MFLLLLVTAFLALLISPLADTLARRGLSRGLTTGLALIFGVPYGVQIGVVAGLLEFIPYLGGLVGMVLTVTAAGAPPARRAEARVARDRQW